MGFSPATMGIMSLGSQIGGTLMSASGSYYGAKSQVAALKGQAKIAESNARISEINARISELGAQSALQQGKHQVADLTMRAGQLKGRQRASMAANGVDLNVGSAAETQASSDILKEIDKGTIRLNAVRDAFGYRTQALNQTAQAGMARADAAGMRAGASGISPGGSAFSTLLGGATQVASNWYKMDQSGMFDTSGQYSSIDALAADKGWW